MIMEKERRYNEKKGRNERNKEGKRYRAKSVEGTKIEKNKRKETNKEERKLISFFSRASDLYLCLHNQLFALFHCVFKFLTL